MKKKTLILLVGLLATAAVFAGCENSDTNDTVVSTNTSATSSLNSSSASENTSKISSEKSSEKTTVSEPAPEPNTSAMVDYISRQAKQDSKTSDNVKLNEAVSFIKSNYPNYFTDNSTMEQTMYYGYLLEYAYQNDSSNKTLANLGQDAYQVVKYVYRGAETTDSESVQSNLKQIKNALDMLK